MPEKDGFVDPLEKMREKLYAPHAIEEQDHAPLSTQLPRHAEGWTPEPVVVAAPRKRVPLSTLFLAIAVGFFVIAGIVAGLVLFLGGRSISSDRVAITLDRNIQTSVSGGESVPISFEIKNNNPVPITGGTVTMTFPSGTTDPNKSGAPLLNFTQSVDALAPGEGKRFTVPASFYGAEKQKVSVPIVFEYRTENSKATFVKKESYDFTITNAPVAISVSALSEISSGQTLTLVVYARSNASSPLSNIAVEAKLPPGFTLATSEPAASGGSLFVLGSLAPGEQKEIRLTGRISGQPGEERVFHFTVGTLTNADSRTFSASYMLTETTVAIAKPFLAVALELNRQDLPTIIARSNESVSALLSWANSLPSPILDSTISIALSGDALDTNSVAAVGGFYQSSTKTVLFSKDGSPGLARLEPRATGNGSFTFQPKSGSAFSSLRNPTITLAVSISGRRITEGNVPEQVTSTMVRTIKIQSDLTLASSVVRTTGPYTNTGAWPPVSGAETTYTILLTAGNNVNAVANTAARMTLPSYVRFTGQASSGVTYNEGTREATWAIGDFAPGSTKTASFQVAFLPSSSQKGVSPTLVSVQTISGVDRFVQQNISSTAPILSIQAPTDPAYQVQYGAVTQ